jgi:broad specificity phosphatase PhoE
MIIKLIRHGESLANTGEMKPHEVGDSQIPLSPAGRQQAWDVGTKIGRTFISQSLIYCSPYRRTRETAIELVKGAGISNESINEVKIYEDPRLREAERGYLDEAAQHEARKVHGWFYYRHSGGESPADCYDRTSAFLESLMRQSERHGNLSVLIVTHGMTIRCFVMRFLHLSVAEFESMDNPLNCDIITIAPYSQVAEPSFVCGRWAAHGIRLRPTCDDR